MALIGITGLPGSGKSYISKYLKDIDQCFFIDADKFGHNLLKTKKVISFTKEHFPTCLNEKNEIIRAKLAGIIFDDPNKYKLYNDFISKEIKLYIVETFFDKMQEYKHIILDAALIFEWNIEKLFDIIIYCRADNAKRLEKIALRGNDIEDYKRRENVLLDENIKIEKSDIIINNNYDERIYESIKEIEKYISEIESCTIF